MDRNEMLRQWMEEHERGPAWVARKTGYRREWISSVLHGRKPFSDKLARRIAEGLGIKFTEDGMVEATRLDEAIPAPMRNDVPNTHKYENVNFSCK